MKFAAWIKNTVEEAGILSGDLRSVHSFKSLKLNYVDIQDFILRHNDEDMEALRNAERRDGIPANSVILEAPIPVPRHDIICLGLNYRSHIKEAGKFDITADETKAESVYFSKRVVRALGPGGIIENHFDINERLDYEAELAFIMGKDARGVRRKDAWNYIFGLCCFNDISGRDLQTRHRQWYFGKSLDTFTAYGPYIVTMDEFEIPLRLNIKSRINGEERQNGNTADLIFSLDFIIEELSSGMTLDAGTIIATGTPAGVGAAFTPHRCMKSGDVCEIEIEGCGILRNTVG
ncbi:MAG: fumarylacetoacetate hydrolase family protein [Treponema sp.]|jgi:2-keto-4-pentenoate hydratase/2-oxohepta-3-ene-1,7-dioic acid hydratase in catechol pathway|nr:fumarylacetoacetate hydrolase family protein [Treponema sp.]